MGSLRRVFGRGLAGGLSVCLFTVGGALGVAAQEGKDDQGVKENPGPYLEAKPPVIDEPQKPRKPVDHDPPSADVAPGEEDLSQRSATSKTFAGEEAGVFETRVYGAPVHFQDDGEWEED